MVRRIVSRRLTGPFPGWLPGRFPGRIGRLASRLPGPSQIGARFSSRLHDERVAAWLGIWLGISFAVTFVTGLISHFMQHPVGWPDWPSRPIQLYRITQGLHVIGGLATIPLLLAKLWTVYPKLWQWPPFRSVGHALERGFVFVLVAGALFQLGTGALNIAYWYPFDFFFTSAHYWTGHLVTGALIMHIVTEWAKVRRAVLGPPPAPLAGPGLSRRGFFASVAAACGIVAVTTVGETFAPLSRLAVLAPRRPDAGPQRLPVNRTAAAAKVLGVARDPDWQLTVSGQVHHRLALSLADLRTMPLRRVRLPISCVEGWSAEATWTGVRLRDVLRAAGVPADATIGVESLEVQGRYRSSTVHPPHWQDPLTLLAIEVNGEPLALDHGYPCRLIAPNRPGVLQTKWINHLVVSRR
jgi:DMSO/TMAO reductase YedYZ molybdopterin-dependent catalytic subunit